jgi:hypothetical protein
MSAWNLFMAFAMGYAMLYPFFPSSPVSPDHVPYSLLSLCLNIGFWLLLTVAALYIAFIIVRKMQSTPPP